MSLWHIGFHKRWVIQVNKIHNSITGTLALSTIIEYQQLEKLIKLRLEIGSEI